MKKILVLLAMIPVLGISQIKAPYLPRVSDCQDSDRIMMIPTDSPLVKQPSLLPFSALKTYLGIGNQPEMLFNHWITSYNSGTGSTDLYNDSIPAGTLQMYGNKIIAFYSGLDSANHADSLTIWLQNIPICKMVYNTAQNWHVDVIIMEDGMGSVRCNIRSNFTGVLLDYTKEISGLLISNKMSLKVTALSSSGSRQIQSQIAYIYFYP